MKAKGVVHGKTGTGPRRQRSRFKVLYGNPFDLYQPERKIKNPNCSINLFADCIEIG